MLPTLPADKANHFVYGAVICCALTLFVGVMWAGLAVLVVAALKEAWDWKHKGTVDLWDVVATCAGGACVAIPLVV